MSSSTSSNSRREQEPLISNASKREDPIVISDARLVDNDTSSVATAEVERPIAYASGDAIPSEAQREAVIVSAEGRRYYILDRRGARYYEDDDSEQRGMLVCIYCCLLFFLLLFLTSPHGRSMISYLGEIAKKSLAFVSKSSKLRGGDREEK